MILKIFSSLVLAHLAVAHHSSATRTTTGSTTTPSPTPSTDGHINIDVAAGGKFVFSPANITAKVGDLVTFHFPGGQIAHSVTQSSFANPCTYLEANGSNPAGFDSGLQLAKTFTINITDTKPIWYHCKQVGHCGLGMVGSINAPLNGANTHAAFVAAAKKIGSAEVLESDSGTPVLTGAGAVATGPPVDGTNSSNLSNSSTNVDGATSSGAVSTSASGTGTVEASPSVSNIVQSSDAVRTGTVEASPSASSTQSSDAVKTVAKTGLYLVAAGIVTSLI